jgi:hypothetical protein
MKRTILIPILLATFLLVGCDSSDSRYDSGYSDGYASGYNTTCKIRATMIEGDWSDKNYSRGYNDGYSDGSRDCRNK